MFHTSIRLSQKQSLIRKKPDVLPSFFILSLASYSSPVKRLHAGSSGCPFYFFMSQHKDERVVVEGELFFHIFLSGSPSFFTSFRPFIFLHLPLNLFSAHSSVGRQGLPHRSNKASGCHCEAWRALYQTKHSGTHFNSVVWSGVEGFFVFFSYFLLKYIINDSHTGWTWTHRHAETYTHRFLKLNYLPSQSTEETKCFFSLHWNFFSHLEIGEWKGVVQYVHSTYGGSFIILCLVKGWHFVPAKNLMGSLLQWARIIKGIISLADTRQQLVQKGEAYSVFQCA